MKNFTKNHRGDIPITILVLGVIAVCMMVIFSFYFSAKAVKGGLNSVGVIQKASVMADKIALYKNLGLSDAEINKDLNLKIDQNGKGYFSFEQDGLSVTYRLP